MGYVHLPHGDEVALLQVVYKIGPIAVGMDAYNLQVTGILCQVTTSRTDINIVSFPYI